MLRMSSGEMQIDIFDTVESVQAAVQQLLAKARASGYATVYPLEEKSQQSAMHVGPGCGLRRRGPHQRKVIIISGKPGEEELLAAQRFRELMEKADTITFAPTYVKAVDLCTQMLAEKMVCKSAGTRLGMLWRM